LTIEENPNTVHGRLLESAHISGYSFERACSELEWLLEDERWRGLGFDDGAAFAESIFGIFADFKISVEQRKPLAKKLTAIASQRAVAKVIGVDVATINRDINEGVASATNATPKAAETNGDKDTIVADATPEWFQNPSADPADLAKKQTTKETKQRDAKKRNEEKKSLPFPDGKYSVIYTDPPWQFEVWSGEGKDRAAENHYPTMTLDNIKALPVADLAADDCALFLWAVMPQLPEALAVIEAWGFEYKTCAFVWVKQTKDGKKFATGMGYWTRANAEICLLATKGSPQRLHADVHQVIASPRGRHSSKPKETYERIERLVGGPYIELFARNKRPEWTGWGNE
jgi:N6-adenosine-specific RNA methylase IME4